MNRREESTELRTAAHLYKASGKKPMKKGASERVASSSVLPSAGFSFPRKLGGRSFTWTKGEDSDLGAKVAALPSHKQKFVIDHLQETLVDKTKKFGINDPRTLECKEYLGIARRSSKRTNKKKKHDKNKGMRKKRSSKGME